MKQRIWRYLGDLRCPCHRCYGKVYASGRGNTMVLKVKCRTTGQIWMKGVYEHWVTEQEYIARFEELDMIVKRLKGEMKDGMGSQKVSSN